MKKGDKVRLKNYRKSIIGEVVGVFEEDVYLEKSNGESTMYACKGTLKVAFDSHSEGGFTPLSASQLTLV